MQNETEIDGQKGKTPAESLKDALRYAGQLLLRYWLSAVLILVGIIWAILIQVLPKQSGALTPAKPSNATPVPTSKDSTSGCSTPIQFQLGSVDSRFGITRERLKTIAQNAAANWDAALAENLFVYDENSGIKVNLVFDSRQTDYNAISQKSDQISALEGEYQNELNNFNAQSEIQGSQDPSWKASLDQKYANLQKLIASYNAEVTKNGGQLETQGEYLSGLGVINIYLYENDNQLELLLMHELGHTKSYKHANSKSSIMYTTFNPKSLPSLVPTREDINLIKNCGA